MYTQKIGEQKYEEKKRRKPKTIEFQIYLQAFRTKKNPLCMNNKKKCPLALFNRMIENGKNRKLESGRK